jgi:hypothetical protein
MTGREGTPRVSQGEFLASAGGPFTEAWRRILYLLPASALW